MIRQLSLPIEVAERLGTREVLLKSLTQLPLGTWVLDNRVALTHSLWLRTRMIAHPRLVRGGVFFVKPRFSGNIERVDFCLIARSLRDSPGTVTSRTQNSSTVVIYLRRGDAHGETAPGMLTEALFLLSS